MAKLTFNDGTVIEGDVSEIKGLGVLRTTNEGSQMTTHQLYERSLRLPTSVKIRKTFVLSEEVAGAVDELAHRSGLERSQLLEMALTDFIKAVKL